MNLARPSTTLLGKVDSAVLGVLYRTDLPLTVREVQRLAHSVSYEGVRLALRGLAETGLLDADERTSGTFYSVNRAHVAYPAVESLFEVRRRLLEQIREAVNAWRRQPVHVSFFGSYARQDGDLTSDIDILVVFEDKIYDDEGVWVAEVGTLEESIRRWTGNHAAVLTMPLRDLRAMAKGKRASALWKSIRSDSSLILGTDVAKVSK